MNTRRYPRTTNEAFPKTADYACSVHRSTRYRLNTLPRVFGAILIAVLTSFAVVILFPTVS